MKDEPTPQGNNNSRPEDDRFVKELEVSNQQTDSLDSLADGADIDEDPLIYYRILRIGSDASLTDIHNAYAKMNDAWHPDRYPHVISWKEKSDKKLKEIKDAYVKLMRLHTRNGGALQANQTSTPLDSDASTLAKPEHLERERPSPVFPHSAAAASDQDSYSTPSSPPASSDPTELRRTHLYRIMGIAITTMILIVLVFLWPSLYHYDAISLGGKEYPLRINRITSQVTYFNGKQWIVPTGPVEMMQQKTEKAPIVPSVPATPPVQALTPAPASPPVQSFEPAKESQTFSNVQTPQPDQPLQRVQPVKPPLTGSSSRDKFAVANKQSSLPQQKNEARPAIKNAPAPKAAASETNAAKPYSIQVIAYQEKEKADALAKRLRGGKVTVRVEDIAIKGKGRWHRVLLGKFSNRDEALKYYNDHKIGKLYPQSFIQKSAN